MSLLLRAASATLRRISPTRNRIYRKKNIAVVVAAGLGKRMESAETKQTMVLSGIPVVVRTLLAFEESRAVKGVIVVARPEEFSLYRVWKEQYHLTKLFRVVAGGSIRQQSCKNGFDALPPDTDYVLIHDGARCLITAEMIEKTLISAYLHGCAASGCRSTDTLKQCDMNGKIMTTLDRNVVWRAQTPQIFRTDVYRAAAYQAEKDGFVATDDCALAEHYGFGVHLVDCGSENLKITTPVDLYYAEAILKMRAEQGEKKA